MTNISEAKFLLRNFLPKSFGIPVCLIEFIGTEILRDPELFNIKSRVPKYFGIPVCLIDITGTINEIILEYWSDGGAFPTLQYSNIPEQLPGAKRRAMFYETSYIYQIYSNSCLYLDGNGRIRSYGTTEGPYYL